jgi:uncharacterized protein (TIGR00369 family)
MNENRIAEAALARGRESFSRQGLMTHLGAEVVALRPGHCEIQVRYRKELTQQHGYFHAGVAAAIADSAWPKMFHDPANTSRILTAY